MASDYEVTHIKDIRKIKRTKRDIEELEELQKYIESCQGGDRPISPKAEKLRRYLYLKEKGSLVKKNKSILVINESEQERLWDELITIISDSLNEELLSMYDIAQAKEKFFIYKRPTPTTPNQKERE